MKKTAPDRSGNSFKILLIFLGLVCMVILFASFFKILSVFAKSSFDGKHRFTVAVLASPIQVLSFAPDAKTISILEIPSSQKVTTTVIKNRLHIPIDGFISEKEKAVDISSIDMQNAVDGYIQQVVLTFPSQTSSLTIVDAIQLWFFVKSVELHNVFTSSLPVSIDKLESAVADKTAATYFSDETLLGENKSIQVVNATGEQGIGTDFAQVLTNIGGNVVSVTTASKNAQKTSITYTEKATYTVGKLEKMLGVKAKKVKKQAIFAIIVTIGEDKLSEMEQ